MTQSINVVTLSGNLTHDAELRSNRAGVSSILNFSIAVNDRRKNAQTDEWEDVANYVDCTLFGARAEKLAQYLTKGTRIALTGKLRYSSWEKDGQKRSKLTVIVNDIEFLSRGGEGTGNAGTSAPAATPAPAADDYDDEVPF